VLALVAYAAAAVMLPQSFRLTTLTDVIETLLLVSGIVSFVPLAARSQGRVRLFWSLLLFGLFLWLSYELLWAYYEVLLRRDVPDPFAGDVILFVHVVPLMAAAALRPHLRGTEYAGRLRHLDFALLTVWWLYLYVLTVMPWQYVVADIRTYNRNLNSVYLAEKFALLVILAVCWASSKRRWRRLYISLLGMSLCYFASSALANWAIAENVYYSGSLYDIPLACAMAWLTWIGLRTQAEAPDAEVREVSTIYGVWAARFSMIAVFSLPLFAVWTLTDSRVPARIRVFRLLATLVAAFLMSVMVFLRQHLLDQELAQLLSHSRESFDHLTRLQAQILQSEKLASIGQLVGGAAHELNNPITAMLGYSDLLLSTDLTPRQQVLAAKIGQDVRRTKSLVASLISFSRHSPAPKAPLDLNTLARTAIKLLQAQCESLKIDVITDFDPRLPKVLGDSNQLLQVCLQLLGNFLHARTSNVLTARTMQQAPMSVLLIAGTAPATGAGDSVSGECLTGSLGLSACQGILREHSGQVSGELREDGTLTLRVELPALAHMPVRPKEATVPVLWQSRPFA